MVRFISALTARTITRRLAKIASDKKLIAYIFIYFVGITILMGVIHETGHAIAALIQGVPFSDLNIAIDGINPSITIVGQITRTLNLAPYYYVGGFSAAFVLFVVYIFLRKRYFNKPSVLIWWIGLITVVAVGFQVGQGIVEGRFHALYIATADSAFNLTDMVIIPCIIYAVVVHLLIYPISKYKNIQAKGAIARV